MTTARRVSVALYAVALLIAAVTIVIVLHGRAPGPGPGPGPGPRPGSAPGPGFPADPCTILTLEQVDTLAGIDAGSPFRQWPVEVADDRGMFRITFADGDGPSWFGEPTGCEYGQIIQPAGPAGGMLEWEVSWVYGKVPVDVWPADKRRLADGGRDVPADGHPPVCRPVDAPTTRLLGGRDAVSCAGAGLLVDDGGTLHQFAVRRFKNSAWPFLADQAADDTYSAARELDLAKIVFARIRAGDFTRPHPTSESPTGHAIYRRDRRHVYPEPENAVPSPLPDPTYGEFDVAENDKSPLTASTHLPQRYTDVDGRRFMLRGSNTIPCPAGHEAGAYNDNLRLNKCGTTLSGSYVDEAGKYLVSVWIVPTGSLYIAGSLARDAMADTDFDGWNFVCPASGAGSGLCARGADTSRAVTVKVAEANHRYLIVARSISLDLAEDFDRLFLPLFWAAQGAAWRSGPIDGRRMRD
ncbi:hypothetical protein Lfu02_02790 [Longispora fulva]|uniref:Uncharacterized protein n=1 Tax=Longispora fulva TaxID=619741 RepID=A0A8J7GC49_9ACTN|nr:hypothetical protein [Longispora fulva]MBG6135849.1 hypothetical protein [Longispora fulva]GIG55907.1 hypothetical protein Lfu02_02790 [Longispora fulva]